MEVCRDDNIENFRHPWEIDKERRKTLKAAAAAREAVEENKRTLHNAVDTSISGRHQQKRVK